MARIFDIVEAPNQGERDMVVRVPEYGSGDFRIGSQVIVRQSQAAVFFRDGKALDVFAPGRHTITTANVPLLANLVGRLFSGQSPFTAEAYFVNLREFLEQKWGTPEPVALRDSDLGMVRLRAFGIYSMQITEPQMFVAKIVGTQGLYLTGQIESYLRGIIISRLTDILGTLGKGLFDLPALFDEIAAGLKARVQDDFLNVGITLKQFYINSISPTEETARAIDERASMGAIGDMNKYLQFKAARAMGDAATSPAGTGEGVAGGLGLGAGIGMGAGLAGMITQAMQGAQQQQQAPQQQAAPAAPPQNPTTPEEVRALLDNLDMRLANGEITESVYERLYSRWEQRLQEMGG